MVERVVRYLTIIGGNIVARLDQFTDYIGTYETSTTSYKYIHD